MNNTGSENWKELQETDAKWLRNEKIWSFFALAFLAGFCWLFLNPHLISKFFG